MFGLKLSYIWLLAGLLAVAIAAQAYIIGVAWKGGSDHEVAKSQGIAIKTIQDTGKAEAKGEAELQKAPSVDAALKKKGWCDDCNSLLRRPDVSGPIPGADVPAAEPAKVEAPAAVAPKPKKVKKAPRLPKTALCEAFNICLAATDKPVRPLK